MQGRTAKFQTVRDGFIPDERVEFGLGVAVLIESLHSFSTGFVVDALAVAGGGYGRHRFLS